MIKSFEHKGLEKFFHAGDKRGIQPNHSQKIADVLVRLDASDTNTIKKRQPTHPGGILKRHYIEPLSLTISEVAEDLGVSRKAVSKIVNEKGSITPDMAQRLSIAFNTTPEMWLNLQTKNNLWMARQKTTGLEKIKLLVPAYIPIEA